jgi:structural maintenance of chromosomes protein 6
LTALTVCLGARASSTQRATSLESLIKEGASEARVIVKISNSGALRFKGDVYGDSILIERRFKRNGPNSFKIKSGESGKIISDKKDEVVAICDNYNIQVENPLSVLTQETAKKFLVNSTPQDLYEFFMRATQLEQLSFDYAYSLDRMKSMQNSLNATKRSWPALEESIENLGIELKAISEQKEMTQKVTELNAEILWANINDQELEIREKEELIVSEQNRINSNNENINLMTQKSVENKAHLKSLDTEITALYSSKKPVISDVSLLERKINQTKENLRLNESVSREINSTVSKLKEELNDIDLKLEESLKDNDSERTAKLNQVEQLEKEVQEKNRQCKNIEEEGLANYVELKEIENSLDNAAKTHDNEMLTSRELSKDLDKAKSASKDRLKFFGESLPEVMKEIEARRREFRYKPVGPIGMYVELLSQKWSLTMDAIIGSHMRSFITHHHEDRVLLDSILRKHKCINPIINVSNEPIDTRDGEPDHEFLTALRALKISNESVKKALIVFANIERIVLIEKSADAREVMMSRLRNVDSVYTLTHRITATQNSLAFFAIFANHSGNPFDSGETRVIQISKQIKENAHRLNILSKDIENLKKQITHKRNIDEELKEKSSGLKRQISALKSDIRTIENSLNSTDETGIDVLKSEKENILGQLITLKSQFGENFDSQLAIKQNIEELEENLNSAEMELERIDDEVEAKKNLLNYISNDERKLVNEIEKLKQSNFHISNSITGYTATLNIQKSEIDSMVAKASAICERIFTKRPASLIQKEIGRLERMIEKGAQFNPNDYDKVKAEYEEKSEEYEKSKINVRINENILDDMKIALEKRQRQWEDLRSGIAKRSNQDFAACLLARDYRGCLEYDHKNRTLTINVHIDKIEQNYIDHNGNTELSKRDIKQLSGGEKSFGTTCFLLSLWDAMGCPIRCLDEFDVYMDAVNRRLVVEMLINNAKNSGTQFILITPVSVRNFLESDDQDNVHMVVLRDPQRGS